MHSQNLWIVTAISLMFRIHPGFAQTGLDGVEFRLQICGGHNFSEEQRETILSNFISTIPFLGRNTSLDAIPSILVNHTNCEAGKYLKRNLRSRYQVGEFNEIDMKTTGFNEGLVTAFISYKNGQLQLTSENSSYTFQQFCISPKIDVKLQHNASIPNFFIFKCRQTLSNCSRERPCLRKCCGKDEYWDLKNSTCTKLPNVSQSWYWNPNFYSVTDDGDCVIKLKDIDSTLKPNFQYDIGPPQRCAVSEDWNAIPSRNIPGGFGLGRFRMLLNGSVMMNYDNGSWVALSYDSYCVDEVLSKFILNKTDTINKGKRSTKVLLVCKEEYHLRGPKRPIPSEYALMLFSAATILLLIVIIYLLLWNRHSIYEWTVFFEVLAMIFMIVFVAVSHTVARDASEGYYGSKKCVVLGMVSHYFILATFFWLFIINFEIWWNFRTLTIRNRNKTRKWLRLMYYQIFGCGGPAIIVLIGWLLDRQWGLQNDNMDCTSLILPNYGQLNCYISKRAQGPYLYFPIGVLLGCNLLFYLMTVFKMCQYQKNSQQISSSKTNGHSQPVVVFARLFIVMGVSWIFEIVAWAIKPRVGGGIPLYWIIFDVVTLVQAIAIFVIFVCRRDVLENLMEKYPPLKKILGPLFCLPCCRKPKPSQNAAVGTSSSNTPRRGTLPSEVDTNSIHKADFDLSLKDLRTISDTK